jgi:outer membrane protein assembly factor BamA
MPPRENPYNTVWKLGLCSLVCFGLSTHVSGQPLTIQSVTIVGTERPLRLETKAGGVLEQSRVARDVRRLWATGWFDDIQVLSEEIPEGTVLRFNLTERPRYQLRKVRFEPRHFELPTPVPVGTLVDKVSMDRLAKSFEEKLQNSGYRDATVNFEVIPAGVHQADVLFRVNQGNRYVVDTLNLSGITPADSRQAEKILRAVKPRRLLPGIPRVSKGWKLRPELNREALDIALQNLRSSYISRGYFDATTKVDSIAFDENRASIYIQVFPGAPYQLEEHQTSNRPASPSLNLPPIQLAMKELCHCLIEKRAQAERQGIADFGAQLLVRPGDKPNGVGARQGVSLSAEIRTGPSYRVRTIEFRGNHRLSDLTLRGALLLSEGEMFDRSRLERSLTRLNVTGLIHPVTESDVDIQQDSAHRMVDLVISVREKDKGQWLLGAPAWPGVTSSSTFSIGTRLPNWGPPFLQLPTYFIALNLRSPLPGLPLSFFNRPLFSVSLARSYLPDQEWTSGFQISPQASWTQSLLITSLLQLKPRLAESLQATLPLEVPVRWGTTSSDEPTVLTAGVLICNPPREPHTRFLNTLRIATEWVLATGL